MAGREGGRERGGGASRIGPASRRALGRVEVLAIFPMLALAATAFGFDDLALVTAFGLSGLLALSALSGGTGSVGPAARRDLAGRDALAARLGEVAAEGGADTACFLVQVDGWPILADRWGHDTCQHLAARIEDRLRAALRNGDLLVRLGDARFGVVLAPVAAARLGSRDAIADRLAQATADPIALQGTAIRLSASIGHSALIRRGDDPAATTFLAAEAALGDAIAHGPGAIRAFAPNLGRARSRLSALGGEVTGAILAGDIQAWFQPQVCARTGAITGMDLQARWPHPRHGLLGDADFAEAVATAGAAPQLGQSLIHQALKSQAAWDAARAHVPSITLPALGEELRDARYGATLAAEVARYGLDPARVRLRIGEDVALAPGDDSILSALVCLVAAGHPLDLDGFGLGATPLPLLQRLRVDRIRIAPGFVHGVDADAGQRAAVSALVAMAAALGLRTLATGVESAQEGAALADLGCDALQGHDIARALRADQVADWARARSAAAKAILLSDRRA